MRIANRAQLVLLLTIAAVSVSSAFGQTAPVAAGDPRAEIALTYNLVRSNAPPGDCRCFLMNGASGSFAYRVASSVSLIGEGGAVTNGNVASGRDLTLATFLGGARYSLHRSRRVTPFGQALVGAAHASGSLAPDRIGLSSSTAFAMSVGGGVDLNLSRHLAWRVVQADYLLTLLPNRDTDTQNNFRFQTGIVIRFGGR